jgi:hypothetical protein
MKPSEAAVLLSTIARTDRRTVSETEARSWAELMTEHDVPINDAIDAVKYHFGHSRDYLMPIHVIDRVKDVRRERLQRAGTPPMPGGLTWQQEKDWRILWCANVKDGLAPDAAAIAASEAMKLPLELEQPDKDTRDAAKERLELLLAESKAAPKPKPENRKPAKPRERWGCWRRGVLNLHDGKDTVIYSAAGTMLYHGDDMWAITIDGLRNNLEYWLRRVDLAGWGDSETLTALARAWVDLTGADDDGRAWALVKVAEVMDGGAA